MSDYDGVQVSGQRDAGKCSAIELVTLTMGQKYGFFFDAKNH